MATVVILHTNDVHGHLTPWKGWEGKSMVEALNHLRYDALAIGNHEPDFGTAVLRQRMKDATFTFLAANLVERKGGKLFTKPYVVKKVGGVSTVLADPHRGDANQRTLSGGGCCPRVLGLGTLPATAGAGVGQRLGADRDDLLTRLLARGLRSW